MAHEWIPSTQTHASMSQLSHTSLSGLLSLQSQAGQASKLTHDEPADRVVAPMHGYSPLQSKQTRSAGHPFLSTHLFIILPLPSLQL